ncbi:hypothetical protein ACFFJX_09110 [Pseudarcicella hirudinis]|uniref:hypothetical protein n=1 Tax=Pseudarcicella hirudinis TaxID=1079859 RepID=UPI0035E78FAB
MTPPDWVQGSWTYHGNQTQQELKTVLTSDNIVATLFGDTENLKTFPGKILDGYGYTLSEPTKTATMYEARVTFLGQKDQDLLFYRWTKLDATHVLFYRKAGRSFFEVTLDKD